MSPQGKPNILQFQKEAIQRLLDVTNYFAGMNFNLEIVFKKMTV
jgi:hypothetical protein